MRDIRTAVLEFHIEFLSSGVLPRYKSFALRGGMGQGLVNLFCVDEKYRRDSGDKCDQCDYSSECIAQKIMYAPFDSPCPFASSGNSEGYMVVCRDFRETVVEGDEMVFRIILLGKTVAFLNPMLSTIYQLGNTGIGKERIPFRVTTVKNERGQEILSGMTVCKEYYRINRLSDMVEYLMQTKDLQSEDAEELEIDFLTPVSLKKEGRILNASELDIVDLIAAADRRYYMICCYDGVSVDRPSAVSSYTAGLNVVRKNLRNTEIQRYSERKSQRITLPGVYGKMCISLKDCTTEERMRIVRTLVRAEILHVGSNTSFGFGKYRIYRPESGGEGV